MASMGMRVLVVLVVGAGDGFIACGSCVYGCLTLNLIVWGLALVVCGDVGWWRGIGLRFIGRV